MPDPDGMHPRNLEDCKTTSILPIFFLKKGSKENPRKYRQDKCMMSVLGKLVRRVIEDRNVKYMNNPYQKKKKA